MISSPQTGQMTGRLHSHSAVFLLLAAAAVAALLPAAVTGQAPGAPVQINMCLAWINALSERKKNPANHNICCLSR